MSRYQVEDHLPVDVQVGASDEETVLLQLAVIRPDGFPASIAAFLLPSDARHLARRLNRAAEVAETYDPEAVSK